MRAKEIELEPGWLKKDMERASERVAQWEEEWRFFQGRPYDGAIVNRHGDHLTLALAHRQHGGLSNRAATGFQLVRLVLVLFEAAM